ncbi:MAG TPA: hypothetical protein PLA50_06270, partial [Bacteroidia bacterium]|nr:hypothetical protein [Bacteroidia bacterium]
MESQNCLTAVPTDKTLNRIDLGTSIEYPSARLANRQDCARRTETTLRTVITPDPSLAEHAPAIEKALARAAAAITPE